VRLVSTLKIINLSSDPEIFEDGEVYFNDSDNTIRMAYSGSWVTLINENNLELSYARKIDSITDSSASFSYMILNSDQNSILLANSASSVTIIIPNNSTENIEIGSSIKIVRSGEGSVQFTEESGVTLNAADSNYLTAQWTSIELVKVDTNNWFIDGEFPDIY
jgi:predicted thioredoxin/glutaredoxin